jgi:two-component system, cell cycle response regulator
MGIVTVTTTRLRGTRRAGASGLPKPQAPATVPGRPSAPALTVGPTVPTEALALPAHTRPHSELLLSRRSRLGVRILGAASLLGLAVYAAHSLLGLGGSGSDSFFEDFLFNALFFAGALLCLSRAWLSSAERGAWCSLGVGLFCWGIGEVIFTLDQSQLTAGPFPSTSDLFWLIFYPAAFLTLGLLVRARVRHFYPSLWLDGVIGALAVAALASEFLLPSIIETSGGSFQAVVGDLIYPLGDLLLICFVVAVLAITGWRPGRVLGAVSLGLLIGASADVLSLYWSATGHGESSFFETLWPASAVVLGLAAWQPARPSAVIGLHGRRLLVFPLCFALAGIGLLCLEAFEPLKASAYVLAVLTVTGVICRMGLTFSENLALVYRSRHEALTDPLTGLGNRRRLLLSLEDVLQSASERSPWALLLFDLNGFKRYNDAFGHPVGDALLARLGQKLRAAVEPEGQAFRLGGDEFCALTPLSERTAEEVSEAAVEALSERGQGFDISTAYGCIMLPAEASERAGALQLVDERLYVDKRSRQHSDAPDQLRKVLLQVMAEREPELHQHLHEVAILSRAVGRAMGLSGEELETMVRAAELHDVGKVAVPDAILQKRSSLDASERQIIERHCEVGERILAAAPAMSPVARLVRSSHERYDGRGYPDRRCGKDIPVGARIIAVCDAFHAMTSNRPYGRAIDVAEALRELKANAGSQFDPAVIEAFCVELGAGHLDLHRRLMHSVAQGQPAVA